MEELNYQTYYVKTTCRHCGKEMLIEIHAKAPMLQVFNADGIGEKVEEKE